MGRPGPDLLTSRESSVLAPHLAVAAVYLLLAGWVTGPLWAAPGQVDPAANTSDPAFFEWMLVHATRIFTHGENPFLTPTLNTPLGVNAMANTGLLGLTVPLVPVTLLFGPGVAFDLMLTLGLVATAGAWYFVLSRRFGCGRLAAAVGGGFAGFAPGLVNHTNAHPNLVAQFLIPFLVWAALSLRTVRGGVVLGLLVTWQALINEELLFLTALALAVFVAGYAAFRPADVRAAARPFLTGLAVAVGVATVLLAYPLTYQFFGPQHYRGLPEFVLGYGADLASYPAFPKLSLAHGAGTLAPQPEENTFFGWPLLLVLLFAVVWLWRRIEVRALALVGVVFAVLSLGATVAWYGRPVWAGAPWSWLDRLPLFDTVVPIRLGLVVVPVVAVLLAFSVDAAHGPAAPGLRSGATREGVASEAQGPRERSERQGFGLGYRRGIPWLAALAMALLPLLPARLPVTPRPAVPAFFTSGAWRSYVSGDRAVLSADTTVWYGGITAMRWGTATSQGYRVVGGYFLGPDATGRGQYGAQPRPTASLLSGIAFNGGVANVGPDERAQAAADIRYWRAAIVVLAPDAPHADELHATLDALFGPGRQVADVWLWDVRPLLP
jgi:hypothetical protein